ncbi:TolC-like outer membrane efflux protein/ RND family [Synechococcus sp. PROS-7-1]|uniref:TolC family protein n=1 Tax=Synechococcus sp. PROS-7-1 TaxID=1442556 RepID=UPI00164489CD|nr:TolC family protein [Synechococcus sp. PROS-7-1]QNI86255.1 TolC-like outer membrane efflux protein/ RND family [Synechococcus sp. PROS-7-1]
MRRTVAGLLLIAGVLPSVTHAPVRAEEVSGVEASSAADGSALIDQSTLPTATEIKGSRPKADPSVLPPAATTLPENQESLKAPPSLALPDKPEQVRIRELRPLTLAEVERLVEVNNPSLKAVASQVQQAKSSLRAALSAWYPTLNLNANGLPQYLAGEQQTFDPTRSQTVNPLTGLEQSEGRVTNTEIVSANFGAQLNWNLIDPARVPQIAAARDTYERARDTYLISLRELRLQAATSYFQLQRQDEQVRIGQQSVRASLVSLRDARARYQAGVATKLEVLEAETQLARDQQLLTNALGDQVNARRSLASLMDLPQDITPTSAAPARVLGLWEPSLQESIIAAYTFREELDRVLLDISINNSNANAALAAVQPVLSIFNNFTSQRFQGETNTQPPVSTEVYGWSFDNSVGLSATWNIFDGGRARAQYRRNKQAAEESQYNFASERDSIRREVEQSFYDLRDAQQNIRTTTREVLSATESLRLARLRFQAGVTTQREVVDNQRDLTSAEVRYADAVLSYNASLAELRRRTGLDQVKVCPPLNLPGKKPEVDRMESVPIEPAPNTPACEASQLGA